MSDYEKSFLAKDTVTSLNKYIERLKRSVRRKKKPKKRIPRVQRGQRVPKKHEQ